MRKLSFLLLMSFIPSLIRGDDKQTKANSTLSPNESWEYLCPDEVSGGIAKAGTKEIVVDLSDGVPRPQEAKVIWAPDSKRFAFTCSPPHAPHTSYETTTLYQLRGDKWVPLDPLVEESSSRAQLAQLARDHAPKEAQRRRIWASQPTRDILRLLEWPEASTAILYAYAAWDKDGRDQGDAAFLFTLKFDAEGKWKVIKTHEMSRKERAAD